MVVFTSFIRCNRFIRNYPRFALNYNLKRQYSYESDGKTSVTLLDREAGDLLMISAFNRLGFRLNSGIFIVGPVIMFPKTVLSWNVANDDDVNEDSLSLFQHLEPPVDVLVIGLSDDNSFKSRDKYMDKFNSLQQMKLNFELLTTENAISTYNFLCIEHRYVAAALIPPLKLDVKPPDDFIYNIEEKIKGKDDYFLADDMSQIKGREKEMLKKFDLPPDNSKKMNTRGFFSKMARPKDGQDKDSVDKNEKDK